MLGNPKPDIIQYQLLAMKVLCYPRPSSWQFNQIKPQDKRLAINPLTHQTGTSRSLIGSRSLHQRLTTSSLTLSAGYLILKSCAAIMRQNNNIQLTFGFPLGHHTYTGVHNIYQI